MLRLDHMVIDPAFRERLRALGLDHVQAVLDRVEGRVMAWSRTSDTLFVPDASCGAGFYLKRYRYPRWPARWRAALRGTLVGPHRARAEARLLTEMIRLGLPAARPVAYGARREGLFVSCSFLLTEGIPQATNLTQYALSRRGCALPPRTLHLWTRELAGMVQRLHASGFSHGQLFWRNLIVRAWPNEAPEFFVLDPRPRHGRRRRSGQRWCHEELAQLCASAAPFVSRACRMRFARAYFGGQSITPAVKQTLREISRQALHYRAHEDVRIHRSRLFSDWSAALEREQALGAAARSGETSV